MEIMEWLAFDVEKLFRTPLTCISIDANGRNKKTFWMSGLSKFWTFPLTTVIIWVLYCLQNEFNTFFSYVINVSQLQDQFVEVDTRSGLECCNNWTISLMVSDNIATVFIFLTFSLNLYSQNTIASRLLGKQSLHFKCASGKHLYPYILGTGWAPVSWYKNRILVIYLSITTKASVFGSFKNSQVIQQKLNTVGSAR